MTYKSVFKCRLCGETYHEWPMTESKSRIRHQILSVSFGNNIGGAVQSMHTAHDCTNGGVGVADFQGFAVENDAPLEG